MESCVDDDPNAFEPNGLITFAVNLPPTSQQSKRAAKDAFTQACREAMLAFPVILYGEVKVRIEWSIHEQDRYETDAAPDVDNILKPLLDGLHGPDALLIDDCQIQEVSCSWIDSPSREQSVSIEIRHRPDDWLRRDKLRFVEFKNCLCMPVIESAPTKVKLSLLQAWERAFGTRDMLLQSGWDWYSAQSVMPILRPFHKSRVIKKFTVVPFEEIKRELVAEAAKAFSDDLANNSQPRNPY
jgi:Holliday junction resolvase RusA-like endonuclease